MKTFSSSEILERLKQVLNITTDVELANTLGIKKTTLSNWKTRNTIDYNLVFSICEQINIDWLVLGRGKSSFTETKTVEEIPNNQLLETVINQAEEIGQLKERIKHLEQRLGKTAGDANIGGTANAG